MDGVILIDKEKKYTSNDVVQKVKRILNTKVGHTGTLDPNATGVLPLLLGNATKLSKYLINHDKEYEATIQLGEKTTTADSEGDVICKLDVNSNLLNPSYIKSILDTFIGKQEQIPPMYSAIKVNGKKLYNYAREGKKVELEPRKIEIYSIDILNVDTINKTLKFNVKCSKGTYIRSLCEDIAEKLETVGYMKDLRRLSVGEFNIKDSIKINEFEKNVNNMNFSNILTIEQICKKYNNVEIGKDYLKKYLNGISIPINESKNNIEANKEQVCRVYLEKKFIGLGILKDGKIKRDLVIQ